MSIPSIPPTGRMTRLNILRLHAINVAKLARLTQTVQNAYFVEVREANGLRSALEAVFDLSRFEYELLQFFDCREQQGSVLDEATLSFETCRRQVIRNDPIIYSMNRIELPEYLTGDELDAFPEYFRHMTRVIENIEEELQNMRVLKQCRVVAMTPKLRDHEYHFPAYICEIIRVLRDAGLRLEFEAPYLPPQFLPHEVFPKESPIRRSVKAEESFFPFMLEAYKTWEKDHLEDAREKFKILPKDFVDNMLAFHELASASHKMTLNEYCRTLVVFFNVYGFLRAGSTVLSKENVQDPLFNLSHMLIDTLTLIGQPKPKSPSKEDLIKGMRDRLERWRKDVKKTEIDDKIRSRIISKLRSMNAYSTQYAFIDEQMKESCYDFEECYCASKALLDRYKNEGRYLECYSFKNPHPTRNWFQILIRFKNSIAVSAKELFTEKYTPELYRDLPNESLCHPGETEKSELDSSELEEDSENLKTVFTLVSCNESDSNRQASKYEVDVSNFKTLSAADAVGFCKNSRETENRQTSDISNPSASKCKTQSAYMLGQTTKPSILPESNERSKCRYCQSGDYYEDVAQLHNFSFFEAVLATDFFTPLPNLISRENESSQTSIPIRAPRPILCKDTESVSSQSVDSFTAQLESEFPRVRKVTRSPAKKVSQSCSDSTVKNSDKNAELSIRKPNRNNVPTLKQSTVTHLYSCHSKNGYSYCPGLDMDVPWGDSHPNLIPSSYQRHKRISDDLKAMGIATFEENILPRSTNSSKNRTEITSSSESTELSNSKAGESSDKGVSEIHSSLEVGATAPQSQAAGSSEKIREKCDSVRGHETSSTDEETFVVISQDDVRNLIDSCSTEEEYHEMQSHIESTRNAERSMCSIM